jgi:VCBS repeat-containing protein
MALAGGNIWRTIFAAPFPSGLGHLTVIVTCAGGVTQTFDGDILFVDPSGAILDSCNAQPLAGATVTLFKNEPYLSSTYVIPDPLETIPSNNPEITAADGLYAWDVVPGRWRVQASKAGYSTVTTSAFDVPPPVLGLDITLTPIAGCNTPPSANNDGYSTSQDTALHVPAPGVLGNDTDADGDALTAMVVSNALNGQVVLAADGSFTYTPNTGFHGTDSFTYRANDGTANSNVATATITVSAVNGRPVARDDRYSTRKNQVLVVRAPGVLANDTGAAGSRLKARLVHGPDHGALSLNRDGSFTYKPKGGFVGQDRFTYQAADGVDASDTASVTISVTGKKAGDDDGDDDRDDRDRKGDHKDGGRGL